MDPASVAIWPAIAVAAGVVLRGVARRQLGPQEDDVLAYGDAESAGAAVNTRGCRVHEVRVIGHRLQQASVLIGGGCAGGCLAVAAWSTLHAPARLAVAAILAFCVMAPGVGSRRLVRQAYAELRGINPRAFRSPRRRALAVVRLAVMLWPAGVAASVHESFGWCALALAVTYFVINPLLTQLILGAQLRLWAPDPAPAELQEQYRALALQCGVTPRPLRVYRARPLKIANAFQVGWFPGFQYVVVTDYLLDEFDADGIDAVLMHELGHAHLHHARMREIGAAAVAYGIGMCIVAACKPTVSSPFVPALAILLLIAVIRVYGTRVLAQERAADDFAAAHVGVENVVASLKRLSAVNALNPHTTPRWDRAQGHPGIASRIGRLQSAAADVVETV